jgi:hypothetical protein
MCAHNQLLVLWTQLAPLNPNHSLTITYMQMPTCGFMWTCKWYFLAVQVSHGWMNQRAIKDWQIWVQLYLKKSLTLVTPLLPLILELHAHLQVALPHGATSGGAMYIMFENHVRSWPLLKKALVYARLFVSIPLYIPLYLRNTTVFKLIPLLCTHVYSYMFSTVLPPRVLH